MVCRDLDIYTVSTHSRPKAAGFYCPDYSADFACFNSQPPEGGWTCIPPANLAPWPFQLTAARRRLAKKR